MKNLLLVWVLLLSGCATFQPSTYSSVTHNGQATIQATGRADSNAAYGDNTHGYYGNGSNSTNNNYQSRQPQYNEPQSATEQAVYGVLQSAGSTFSNRVSQSINSAIRGAF